MVSWKHISDLIKHDGRIPKSKEEIELERMHKDRIERENKLRQAKKEQLARENKLRNKLRQDRKEQLAREAEELRTQKIKDEIEWEKGAEKRLLDAEEAKLNGELNYLDKLESKCKKCGKDILDINGTCSADKCGAYRYQTHAWSTGGGGDEAFTAGWSINKSRLME